jgi:PAS domain S-box-containing protein
VSNADRRAASRSCAPAPEALLAAIVNSSDDAIISKDLDGTITSWNEGAQRLFGYTAEEMLGESIMRLIPPDRQNEEPRIIERLRRGERVDHFETQRMRKGGGTFHVSLTISPVRDAGGTIVGASKIARDITGLKAAAAERDRLLESERAARSLAERANRMKDEFLATVSHELRTPLNAIVGWTDVLSHAEGANAEVMHGVDIIRKNAMMQAQLIDDLLDLGRVTSGKLMLHAEPMDLPETICEAVASLQHAADANRVSMHVVMDYAGGRIFADPKRLRQVIWNLVANSIKFTGKGGTVTVSARSAGDRVEITVSDNGRGIAPEFLPHLFERFSQADSTSTRQHGGLGIGLALVRQLVEMHDGTVSAQSGGLGKGATFTVSLPAAKMRVKGAAFLQERAQEPGIARLTDLSGLSVLVVDDDADSLEVVARILTSRKARVRTATSAAKAMEVLKDFLPDLVISDIGMPETDGHEFVRWIRRLPALADVPAVALTAFAQADDRRRALSSGFQAHISKPLSAAELVAAVGSMARRRAPADPGNEPR